MLLISLFPKGQKPKISPLDYLQAVLTNVMACRLPLSDGSPSPTTLLHSYWNNVYVKQNARGQGASGAGQNVAST